MLSGCAENALDQGFVAQAEDDGQIVGGTLVQPESKEAASVVMISVDSNEGVTSICTGTFISENLIITAAHCVNENINAMGVMFGTQPFAQGFTKVEIAEVFLNKSEGAKHFGRNDVALIRFIGGLPAGANIVDLPTTADTVKSKLTFKALGYGRTTGAESEDAMDLAGAGTLRSVMLSSPDFSSTSPEFNVSQLGGQGVCFGDSGGPALIQSLEGKDVVIGIASGVYSPQGVDELQPGFNACTQKSVYMNVIAYLPWIESVRSSIQQ